MNLSPKQLSVLLAGAIKSKRPVLITGAPGIGKSEIVERAAVAADANLILSHPAVSDPTDVKGLPCLINGAAVFVPFGELDQALKADRSTVWFLDDLGQASPAVQASYMQLLLARRVNGHMLSDHVTFVGATNRRTDRAGVSGILEPVKSRFTTIVELEPNLDEWCQWAINNSIAPEMVAFLRFRSDLLCKFTASADLVNCPVPRTWTNASRVLDLNLPNAIQAAAVAGAVGEGAATEFLAFLKLYRELPNVDQILIDPNSVEIPTAPNVLYALAGALAHKTTDTNFSRVAQFVERMVAADKGEFAVLTVRDAINRHPTIVHTQAFVKLATGELGSLISGN